MGFVAPSSTNASVLHVYILHRVTTFWNPGCDTNSHILQSHFSDSLHLSRFRCETYYQGLLELTTGNFQFVLILASSLDKSSSDTSACCRKKGSLLACARQAEFGITLAMRAFVFEARDRKTTGWIAMR